ncbi:hypothetical protein M427DRAFT_315134 [Gonapodya prolifera JEL478]|uniref:Uncharacterized protein n=1 Tax=Gonapodya prolifera (strain JEL478) TaxID=1344416 RepID=A0A139AX34_GONPJ|nr:hypothetical protein M427DRAFT_315134 [Gonapodya prolifera JEL478]|eukprot:KXS21264.1 hypothetical protein M427DRAFT_315134 [Gonapodya prolifera JEL478]
MGQKGGKGNGWKKIISKWRERYVNRCWKRWDRYTATVANFGCLSAIFHLFGVLSFVSFSFPPPPASPRRTVHRLYVECRNRIILIGFTLDSSVPPSPFRARAPHPHLSYAICVGIRYRHRWIQVPSRICLPVPVRITSARQFGKRHKLVLRHVMQRVPYHRDLRGRDDDDFKCFGRLEGEGGGKGDAKMSP